jgi:hypothetical protein
MGSPTEAAPLTPARRAGGNARLPGDASVDPLRPTAVTSGSGGGRSPLTIAGVDRPPIDDVRPIRRAHTKIAARPAVVRGDTSNGTFRFRLAVGVRHAFAIERSDVSFIIREIQALAALARKMPVCTGATAHGARELHHQGNEWSPPLPTKSRPPGTRIEHTPGGFRERAAPIHAVTMEASYRGALAALDRRTRGGDR